ncbi:MAG: cytochrome c [Phenylobacterium sp.]|uniref:c-type cytochrome n=1 Tax=Phenylobacterium sp. TaxID=1871053 RepID=UPI0027267EAE|nr:cytochrome c [Phenylobacterium sp.]MDO8900191.1 cytochrome c [Phenylobacterium sp.]
MKLELAGLTGALAVIAASAAAFIAPSPATAESAAERAVTTRQAGFKQIGAAFKAVNDGLRGGKPDMAAVAAAAGRLETHAGHLPTWFPRGSGPESGARTEARAEVWGDAAGFADAAANLRTQTARLTALAQGGDVAASRTQAVQVAAACKACHTKYRQED